VLDKRGINVMLDARFIKPLDPTVSLWPVLINTWLPSKTMYCREDSAVLFWRPFRKKDCKLMSCG
jgi:hypothetical protein